MIISRICIGKLGSNSIADTNFKFEQDYLLLSIGNRATISEWNQNLPLVACVSLLLLREWGVIFQKDISVWMVVPKLINSLSLHWKWKFIPNCCPSSLCIVNPNFSSVIANSVVHSMHSTDTGIHKVEHSKISTSIKL
jgi:hypothetical protein